MSPSSPPGPPGPNDHPPSYYEVGISPAAERNWADKYYEVLSQAQCSGFLRAVPQRHWILFIDDNFRLDPQVHIAIKLFAACLLPIFRAFQADARLYFTSQRNHEYEPLSTDCKERAKFLDTILSLTNWEHALEFVRGNANHDHRGILQWMMEQDGGLNDFHALLSVVRRQLQPYRYGWDIEEVDLNSEAFAQLYDNALKSTEQQGHILNNLDSTLQKSVTLIEHRLAATHAALPTEVLILTGTSLQQMEIDSIQDRLRNVTGNAVEAGISTLLFVQSPKDPVIKQHEGLRNANEAIYDTTHIVVSDFLEKGPSKTLIGKILNRHDIGWRARLREGKKYGKNRLLASNEHALLTSVDDAITSLNKTMTTNKISQRRSLSHVLGLRPLLRRFEDSFVGSR